MRQIMVTRPQSVNPSSRFFASLLTAVLTAIATVLAPAAVAETEAEAPASASALSGEVNVYTARHYDTDLSLIHI